MSKDTKQKHRWSGAGYVCADCGAVKDTGAESKDCSGNGSTGFDLWLYHAGAGWWLEEDGLATAKAATVLMAKAIGEGNTVAGAVLPAGQPLGLFTKRETIEQPACRECLETGVTLVDGLCAGCRVEDESCEVCNGTGYTSGDDGPEECDECGGEGVV